MLINAYDFKTIAISVNQDAVDEYNKIVQEARENGIVNIYASEYTEKLRELENVMNASHVLNGIIERYIEVIKLKSEPSEGAN